MLNKDLSLVDSVNNVFCSLCKNFTEICRTQPTKAPKDIPGAPDAMSDIVEFEKFVEKYFGLVFNYNTYMWENITDEI